MTDDQFSPPAPATAAQPPAPDPLAAPVPPGWYPEADGQLRYWDGASWSEHTAPAARPIGRSADYGEKYKRRYPVVLLVAVLLSGAAATTALPPLGRRLPTNFTTSAAVFAGIGMTLLLFLTAAVWTLIVALFRGEHREPDAPRPPRLKRAWTWALISMVVLLPLRVYEFDTVAAIPPMTVSGPAEGCREYLDVTLLAAHNHATIPQMPRYYQPLSDAATATYSPLAEDLRRFISNPKKATFEEAEKAILTRCIDGGQISKDQLDAWVADLRKAG